MADEFADAPTSCRSCAFFVKCFGQPDEGPLVRPPIVRDLWQSFPTTAGGLATRMITAGARGTPVLLVHGEGGSADRWSYNFNALARAGYRVAAMDLPGHGFADKPAGFVPSIAAYADVVRVLAERFREPVVLVGASTMAHVALRVAADAPGLVRGLALVSGTGLPVGPESAEKLQRQVIYRTREGALERLRRSVWDTRVATRDVAEQEFRQNMSPGAIEAQRALGLYIGQDLEAGGDVALLRRVAQAIPTMIVWGEEDRLAPVSLARDAVAAAGHARLSVMPRTGHLPFFERPGEFNAALIGFLDSLHRMDDRVEELVA